MPSVLIVGATRGLGANLAQQYGQRDDTTVYGTTRSAEGPEGFTGNVKWLTNADLMHAEIGETIVEQLPQGQLSVVVSTVKSSPPRGFSETQT